MQRYATEGNKLNIYTIEFRHEVKPSTTLSVFAYHLFNEEPPVLIIINKPRNLMW